MPELDRDGDVFVLDIGDGPDAHADYRFSNERVAEINALLDEVEASEGPAALVTVAAGKVWSNGLVPDEFFGPNATDPDGYLSRFQALLARMLTFPMATVAAIQGHAFGGGALYALAHDVRYQRNDRGWFCLPEVELGMGFPGGLAALVQAKTTPQAGLEAMAFSQRYTGDEAVAAGIAQGAVGEDDLVPGALARAAEQASKRGPVLRGVKNTLYRDAVAALTVG